MNRYKQNKLKFEKYIHKLRYLNAELDECNYVFDICKEEFSNEFTKNIGKLNKKDKKAINKIDGKMKHKKVEKNTNEEVQALCGFAMEAMFHDTDLSEEDILETIIKNKDKMVSDFKRSIQKECGIPDEITHGSEIGEA